MKELKMIEPRSILVALKHFLVLAITLVIFGCGGGTPTGFDSDFHLIIPQTGAVAGDDHIDGLNILADDPKWVDAFDIQLIDGVPIANNNFWGVADGSYLYLYFATSVDEFSALDAVAIALSPTADPSQKHLLLINPCANTAPCLNSSSNIQHPNLTVTYYTDPDGDNTYDSTLAAHNVIARAYASAAGAGGVWAVEVRIPRGAPFNLPATGFFGFYANVMDFSNFGVNVFELTWPFNNDAGTTLAVGSIAPGSTDAIPEQAHWGNASLDASLPTGVSILSRDISTDHGSSIISINEPNIFTARVHNHGTTHAQAVQANFQLANFGLPAFGSWESIGNGLYDNPLDMDPPTTTPNIDPTATRVYSLNWSVPPDRVDDYTDHDHQCVRVQLSSTNMATSFINTSAQRNMDFVVTSSPFTSKPSIATAGYHLVEQMRREEFIIRERFYNYRPELKWESRIEGAKKIKDQLYQLSIPIKQSQNISLAVQPPEKALVPFKKLTIPAIKEGLQSEVIRLPLAAGQLVSLVPNRQLRNVGRRGDVTASNATAVNAEKMKAVREESGMVAATVLASWDNFKKSSFIINAGTSLIAPKGAEVLYLKQQIAKGEKVTPVEFTLNIYVTDPLDLPRHLRTTADFSRDKFGFVGFGANLPTVAYFGYRKSGKTLEVNGKRFNVFETAGSFGYVVKGRKADQ